MASLQARSQKRPQQQASSNATRTPMINKSFVHPASYQYLAIRRARPTSHRHHLSPYNNPIHYILKHLQCSLEEYCTRIEHRSVSIPTSQSLENSSSRLRAGRLEWKLSCDAEDSIRLHYSNMNHIQGQNGCFRQDLKPTNKRAAFNSKNLSLLLIISTLLSIHNALPCSSFDSIEHDHDSSLVESYFVSIKDGRLDSASHQCGMDSNTILLDNSQLIAAPLLRHFLSFCRDYPTLYDELF